jgi:hypothetical protein
MQVLAEMLARGMLGNANQPPALLIAPTTSLVATVAMQKDASLRIPQYHGFQGMEGNDHWSAGAGTSTNGAKVHVVHGMYDTTFCPNQQRWNGICGVQLHTVRDNHVLARWASLRMLENILEQILPGGRSRGFSGDGVST